MYYAKQIMFKPIFQYFSSITKEEPSPCNFDITSLNYCDSGSECPCGLEHCHHLDSPTLATYRFATYEPVWKKGVCTPPIKACIKDEDCNAVGNVHTSGLVGVKCKNNMVPNEKECQYSGGIMIA